MSTLTIRLPDDKHERLRQLAEARKMSLNKLMEELSTRALTEYDIELRLRARAARGSREDGLRLLDEFARFDEQHGYGDEETYPPEARELRD